MRDWKAFDRDCRSLLAEVVTLHLIVQRKGLNGAATELGLSRQTISNRRAAIEQALGGRLLELHARGQATPLGTRAHSLVKEILRNVELFFVDAERMRNGKDIRIASMTSAWSSEKAILEDLYKRTVPDGDLVAVDAGDDFFSIEVEVREGRADVGIVSYPPKHLDPPMVVEHWRNERMMFVISGHRRLHRPIVKAETGDFENHDTFVTLRPKFAMAKELAAYLSRHRIRLPHKLSHCSDIDAIKQAVIADDGLSILPEPTVIRERKEGRLQVFPLKHPLVRPIGIIYRKDSLERPAVQAFLNCFPREKRPAFKAPPFSDENFNKPTDHV